MQCITEEKKKKKKKLSGVTDLTTCSRLGVKACG